jgi:hypothetical protein
VWQVEVGVQNSWLLIYSLLFIVASLVSCFATKETNALGGQEVNVLRVDLIFKVAASFN